MLKESEVETSTGEKIDTEKEKEELAQTKQNLEDIAQMKAEIEDTANKIFEENLQETKFVIRRKTSEGFIYIESAEDGATTFNETKAQQFSTEKDAYEALMKYKGKTIDLEADNFDIIEEDYNKEKHTQDYIDLDQELDRLIAADATDKELSDFLEEASFNEVITNKEYTLLQNKAQNIRKIESKETNTQFPSTEYTEKPLTVDQIKGFDCEKDLTEEQIQWLDNKGISLEEFEESLKQLASFVTVLDKPILSINDYINYLKLEGGIQ